MKDDKPAYFLVVHYRYGIKHSSRDMVISDFIKDNVYYKVNQKPTITKTNTTRHLIGVQRLYPFGVSLTRKCRPPF